MWLLIDEFDTPWTVDSLTEEEQEMIENGEAIAFLISWEERIIMDYDGNIITRLS